MCFGLLFLFGKRDRLDVEMFWKPWLLFLCHSLVLFHVSACEEGLVHLEFMPSLSLSLHINLSHKRYHLSLQDLPFLYPWALADAAGTAGICWICSSCGPHLFVFYHKAPGLYCGAGNDSGMMCLFLRQSGMLF